MACDEIKNLLYDFAEGTLPEAQARKVREHVETCKSCHARHQEILALDRALTGVKALRAPAPAVERTKMAIRAEADKAYFRRLWAQRVAVAAAVILVTVVALWQPVQPGVSAGWTDSARATVQAAARGFLRGAENVLTARGVSTAQLGLMFRIALVCIVTFIAAVVLVEEAAMRKIVRRLHIGA
jgi:anti-sigma factor RsiW